MWAVDAPARDRDGRRVPEPARHSAPSSSRRVGSRFSLPCGCSSPLPHRRVQLPLRVRDAARPRPPLPPRHGDRPLRGGGDRCGTRWLAGLARPAAGHRGSRVRRLRLDRRRRQSPYRRWERRSAGGRADPARALEPSPDGVPVAATRTLLPHLSRRVEIYTLPEPFVPDRLGLVAYRGRARGACGARPVRRLREGRPGRDVLHRRARRPARRAGHSAETDPTRIRRHRSRGDRGDPRAALTEWASGRPGGARRSAPRLRRSSPPSSSSPSPSARSRRWAS